MFWLAAWFEPERERAGVPLPPVRVSLSSSLPLSASDSSLSAVDEGLFLAAFFTRESPDLFGPVPAGVVFLRPVVLDGVPDFRLAAVPAPLPIARGPALPARCTPAAV